MMLGVCAAHVQSCRLQVLRFVRYMFTLRVLQVRFSFVGAKNLSPLQMAMLTIKYATCNGRVPVY
jgi:hypothetical protein